MFVDLLVTNWTLFLEVYRRIECVLFAGFAVTRGRSEMWNEDCREECDQ